MHAVVDRFDCYLPLEGLVDLEKERKRLEKERDQVSGRLKGVRAKLANDNFTSRAPAEVVEREQRNARGLRPVP